ncbi:MAG: hypothetical protein A2918_00500 [Candidatus Yanofskybacteria bacterium RIFCSPLOWO2_01_FULL_42_49]|uniref:PQ-loop repeat-containing protein n=1 Tax=Candidatus Yanofskybacteria bacterium RIFCSPLOWO2_01_FULL_42_49 TaxID=1802694 RepID=A0A1F8GEP1_9BACT|nr:MAG: hypothetical protein A2918_00500 [Candidatus Yanofskybacteria bacterium RIFCSPLOWO2_01_FULL_42_49]
MYNFIDVLSLVAIFVFIVSSVPQIGKLLKNKTAKDISFLMVFLVFMGDLLMLVRSINIGDILFIINYSTQSALWLFLVILILKYRSN